MVEPAPEFAVLGTLEVCRGDRPIRLPSGRQRHALAALLVHAGRPVSGDQLIGAVWGAEGPADPQAALYTVVSRLRTALGPGVLSTEPAGYRLAVAPAMIDAHRFEELRNRAFDRPPAEAAVLLGEALALWRDAAYVEFADSDFARGEATRLDQLRLGCTEDRAALALQLGRADDAAIAMEALVRREPFRDRARGLLMRALYDSGRQAAALESFRRYRTMLAEELGLDPSPALCDLHAWILGHDAGPGTAVDTGPGTAVPPRRRTRSDTELPPEWPTALNSFIGREADAERLLRAATTHRLVCVTGPGGVGKTRLVAESVRALGERLGAAIVVVELAGTREGQVDIAVEHALRLGPAHQPPRDSLLEYLSVTSLVLVLDNCEHVLAETRALLHAIERHCPDVRVVATSRHRLDCAGEQVLPLEPLPTPRPGGTPHTAQLSAAVRLFADRVHEVRPSFDLTGDALAMAADICRRLDGLPLALELAACRAATLGLAPLHDRIGASLDLLGERATLRGIVEWSYQLLHTGEQTLLAELSVFDGPFDLDAAEQVCSADAPTTAVGLARLVDASLLVPVEAGGPMRYRLLEIVRAFAAERLAANGQDEALQLARARWAQGLVEECAAAATGPSSAATFARLDRGLDNLTGAVRWCLRHTRLQLAGHIVGPLGLCPHGLATAELYRLTTRIAEHPGVRESPAAALALGAGAEAAVQIGELGRAARLAELARLRATTPAEHYVALLTLGIVTLYRGEHDRALRWWRDLLAVTGLPAAYRADANGCLALLHCYYREPAAAQRQAAAARKAADRADAIAFRAFATYVTGEVLLVDHPEAAVTVLREAATQADRAGRTSAGHVGVIARIALLSALIRLGRHREAVGLAAGVLQSQLRAGTWPQLWTTARVLAELFAALGRYPLAQLMLSAADAAPSAPLLAGADVARYQHLQDQLRRHLATETRAGIIALADGLPRAEVIARAQDALSGLAECIPQTTIGAMGAGRQHRRRRR